MSTFHDEVLTVLTRLCSSGARVSHSDVWKAMPRKSHGRVMRALDRLAEKQVIRVSPTGIEVCDEMRSVVTGHRIWSEEDVVKVRACYAAGTPVIDCARELGTTSNAVIGKATRLGLRHASWYGIGNVNGWKTRRERYGACGRKPFEMPADG